MMISRFNFELVDFWVVLDNNILFFTFEYPFRPLFPKKFQPSREGESEWDGCISNFSPSTGWLDINVDLLGLWTYIVMTLLDRHDDNLVQAEIVQIGLPELQSIFLECYHLLSVSPVHHYQLLSKPVTADCQLCERNTFIFVVFFHEAIFTVGKAIRLTFDLWGKDEERGTFQEN